ncbi:hypothetical protein ABIA31_001130 [Catenulispora sp. MAP5-51]|uniref:hypothetical protein n=1 Tax=Catenulispora sp. MAP5-51 TaxID=3156298 RepID=UPI003512A444
MNNQQAPLPTLDQEAVRTHFRTALRYRTPTAMWTAIADIPVLLAELDRALTLLTCARTDTANLLAAGRATLAALDDNEPDPLVYLRDEVAEHQPADGSPDEPGGRR